MIRAILACDNQGGIARAGTMPWPRNKKDLAHFKQLTNGAAVVMGRKTWEAPDMPKPLPGRDNYIVTRDKKYVAEGGTIITKDLTLHLTEISKSNKVFVIGGAELFLRTIDQIDILHLARITGNYDCDTFLPLDVIEDRFELIDSVAIDRMTTFETYLMRNPHDVHSSSGDWH